MHMMAETNWHTPDAKTIYWSDPDASMGMQDLMRFGVFTSAEGGTFLRVWTACRYEGFDQPPETLPDDEWNIAADLRLADIVVLRDMLDKTMALMTGLAEG